MAFQWCRTTFAVFCCLIGFCSSGVANSLSSEPELKIGTVLAAPQGAADPSRPMITLLVSPFAYPNIHYPLIPRTIEAFQKLFGPNNFRALVSSGDPEDLEHADLILCSAGTYLRMQGKGAARDLATAVSDLTPDPNHAEGSLFITRKDRTDINTFEDMKGKRVATTGPNAFAGYHVALAEIARRGENPDKFFSAQISTGFDMREVLTALRNNRADIGIVRTCFLEELQRDHIDVTDIKPLIVRDGVHPAACLSSTALYPNWSVLATPRLSASLARETSLTLLSMPADAAGLHWSITSNFRDVDAMYKSIRQGPYLYLRQWTWQRFWNDYWQWMILGLAAIAGLIAHSYRVSHLVRLRTQQLKGALHEQLVLERRAVEAQNRMQSLQRAGAVGQMSSIVAHELRQPLSTITSYAHGIERLLDQPGAVDKRMISHGVAIMNEQAKAAEAIVKKVRSYAKRTGMQRTEVNLSELARKVVATVNAAQVSPIVVDVWVADTELMVWGDSMELELALQNLIQNALQALQNAKEGEVTVSVRKETGTHNQPHVVISVADNGRRLSDEEFADLSRVFSSNKLDGLGLGLSIVRLIMENHGGQLEFVRGAVNGLCVRMVFPQDCARPAS